MIIALHHAVDDPWLHRFPQDFPEHEWRLAFSPADAERALAGAEILLLANRACTPEFGAILHRAPALKWIHFTTAGMERGIAMGLPEHVRISHSPGIKASMVAEHAIALLLALVRRLPYIGREQRAHRWERDAISDEIDTLEEKTVCIVGLGHIGRDIARKLRAFGAKVIAVSRAGKAGGDVAEVFPRERAAEALSRSDAVILCTQADVSNRHFLGDAAFAALKPGGYVVNVARGSLIDERAMIGALQTGRLAGAGLDVQETEPLPATSPLWDIPNLILSPHSAGAGSSGYVAHRALFAENLARYVAGSPLLNEVK
jgi:phosphoglycerate dehydrogenase-like enzyme